MHTDITQKRDGLAALCRRYGVTRLEVFGSAARGLDFDRDKSDFDFLVEFDPESSLSPLNQFFGLADALESLFGRPVDLIEAGVLKNPFVLADINRSREVVYES
jgi:predicted nucleotidyltransferase